MKKTLERIKLYCFIIFYRLRGYTGFATTYIYKKRQKEKDLYSKRIRQIARRHGFFAESWKILQLNKINYKDYLRDYDYISMHPINGVYSKWIDDKLTTKYILGALSEYMPKYYFLITKGKLHRLVDAESFNDGFNALLNLLKNNGALAFKQAAGSLGIGFYKVQYSSQENKIFVNGKVYEEQDFNCFVKKLDNYIITEFLNPCKELAEFYDKSANTVRYLVANTETVYPIRSFIRFGTENSGYVDNLGGGGILCYLNSEGKFCNGYYLCKGIMEETNFHNKTNKKLQGAVPYWDELQEIVSKVCKQLNFMPYLGFDFIITENGPKVIEINSLASLFAIQFNNPLMRSDAKGFYKSLIKKKRDYE